MTEHDFTVIALVLSLGSAALNIVLVPLAKSAARGEVMTLIDSHNDNENAHPNLSHADKIEEAVRSLAASTTREFQLLRDQIANLRVDFALAAKEKQ